MDLSQKKLTLMRRAVFLSVGDFSYISLHKLLTLHKQTLPPRTVLFITFQYIGKLCRGFFFFLFTCSDIRD